MTIARHAMKPDELPTRFRDMAAMYPPHAIVDEVDYDNTVEIIDTLLRIPQRRMTKDQEQYLLTLSQLVGIYDDQHYAPDLQATSHTPDALGFLRDLLADHEMTASDLGRLLGDRTLGSKILKGRRQISKAHARLLSDYFKLDAGIFIR